MTMTIGARNEPAARTTFRGVLGIDFDHLEAERFGFVSQESFKLVKRPAVDGRALFLMQAPIPNAVQFFNRNRGIACLLCKANNTLADNVVHVFVEASLFALQPLQNAPDRARVLLCLVLLQRSATFGVAFANVLDVTTAEEDCLGSIGSRGDVIQATVYTDHGSRGLLHVGNVCFEGNGQINLPGK